MIKAREVACLKTTGEKVFILSDENSSLVKVRRPCPNLSNGTLEHLEETFRFEELESVEDNFRREISEMILKAKIQNEMLRAERVQEASDKPLPPEVN